MKYTFTIEIVGIGNSPEEAWLDATEAFNQDPGVLPQEFKTQKEEQ